MSAAYLTITNLTENDDTLLSIDCDEFEVAEFHSMTEENGVTKMDQMDYVLIKGGTKAIFEPGASHIMLVNNKHDLKAGQKITLKLHFQNAGLKTVLSIVKNIEEQAK